MNTKLTFMQKYSYSIIFGIIIFLFLFLVFGCSARNVTKDENKTDSTAIKKIEVAVKQKETVKEITKTDSTSNKKKQTIVNVFEDALELEPIDPKQESSFTDSNGNTKTFKNARVKTNKVKDNSVVHELEIVRKIEEKDIEISLLKDSIYNLNSEVAISKEVIKKLTEKEQFNWSTFVLSFWWLWLLIVIALYLCYRYYKGLLKFPLL
jgi:hypothetical protein